MVHQHPHSDSDTDPACAMAHGDLPAPTVGRRLALGFASPVAAELAHFGAHLGFQVVVIEPDPQRRADAPGAVADVVAAALDEHTDVVVTDHDRPELGDLLAAALAARSRWIGVMGSLRHTAPHVAALRERGLAAADIARVHRPIGLDVGAHSPAEIAVATLAGLLADRHGRPGGPFPRLPA